MIHYHGTPIGGPRGDAARFLAGRHALVSFAHPRELALVAEACRSFVLDNGAFTHWRKGGRVDVAAYRDWVNTVAGHPGLDWALVPDTIDGTTQENDDLEARWLDLGVRVDPVVVWHLHEPLERLDRLVASYRTVALGSSGQWASPGTRSWWQRMAEVMAVACDSQGRPRARLHGLRMLDPDIFTRLPLASADSVNAALNCGRIHQGSPPEAWQRATVIAWRIEAHTSAAAWACPGQQPSLGLAG